MGPTINVECGDCGYAEDGLAVGRGMAGDRDDEVWPVSCAQCKAVVSSKINRTPVVCAKCGSPDVTALGRVAPWSPADPVSLADYTRRRRSGRGAPPSLDPNAKLHASTANEKFRWGDRVIKDEPYRCPRCGAPELRAATRPGLLFD
jgi:DNA-directed RNA polymerase subunit RPC12/RpoP